MKGEVRSPKSEVNSVALGANEPAIRTSSSRFTLDGSDTLEAHLAEVCVRVRDGVRAIVPAGKLEGVLLGGGYGRGEGGVLRTPGGDRPYNDLESFVFVRGHPVLAERKFRHLLHELGERLSPAAGLEVEFKVITFDKLRGSGPSMFYYDLVMGHRWLVGEESLLAGCDQHRDPSRIPLHEATRLLLNRCSGLLFALERLQRQAFTDDDADFVGRNLAKAQLAFGDVLLTAHGQYHWSCRERHARLKQLASLPEAGVPVAELLQHHAAGVEFKLHPVRSNQSRETLVARHAELSALGRQLWLWLEGRRLGAAFATPRDYAASELNKCPETAGWRNRVVNLRAFGAGAALGPHGGRYPRERLFHALCCLLWREDHESRAGFQMAAADRSRLHRELATSASDLPGLVAAYGRIWSRFN
jgi:hypothetical protein